MGNSTLQAPLLVSFSGLDGSGKSTQMESLGAALHAAGLTTRRLAFWDDVVVGVKYREGFVHKVYKSERGIGAPGKPVNRRDKNMRGWHLTLVRHFLYLLDAINLRRVIAREKKTARKTARQRDLTAVNRGGYAWAGTTNRGATDVILFDRYIYDELANLNLQNPLSRAFFRLVRSFTPRPDIAYLLDADPAAACARKPEYPVDFMKQCRRSYFELATLLGNMTVIPALNLPEARRAVLQAAAQRLAAAGRRVDLVSGSVSVA
ncbi:MAG TPA: thymidylate kinase [Candidatus Angelobacter sp.]